jgi:hypothetical protein
MAMRVGSQNLLHLPWKASCYFGKNLLTVAMIAL